MRPITPQQNTKMRLRMRLLAAVLAVGMDLLISALLLRRTGKRECLQWYRRESRKAFLDTSG